MLLSHPVPVSQLPIVLAGAVAPIVALLRTAPRASETKVQSFLALIPLHRYLQVYIRCLMGHYHSCWPLSTTRVSTQPTSLGACAVEV